MGLEFGLIIGRIIHSGKHIHKAVEARVCFSVDDNRYSFTFGYLLTVDTVVFSIS